MLKLIFLPFYLIFFLIAIPFRILEFVINGLFSTAIGFILLVIVIILAINLLPLFL